MSVGLRAAKVYLKAGVNYALDYWKRQMLSQYYKTSKKFKELTDREYNLLLKKFNNNA